MGLVPAYTLETLDESAVERLLSFYFWDYRRKLYQKNENNNMVYKNGKAYKVVKPNEAKWIDDIFNT